MPFKKYILNIKIKNKINTIGKQKCFLENSFQFDESQILQTRMDKRSVANDLPRDYDPLKLFFLTIILQ